MLYYNNIEDPILLTPAKTCNKLQIITGFTDCERISTHLIKLTDGAKENIYQRNIEIEMILGMYKGASITERKHQRIQRLLSYTLPSSNMPKFSCRYIIQNKEVHSKLYIWSKDNEPQIAFCGSANYSINAFQNRRECMTECNAKQAEHYYQSLFADSMDCLDDNIKQNLKFIKQQKTVSEFDDPDNDSYTDYNNKTPLETATISLLTADGRIGYGSSVNWGIRQNGTKRDPNQAYIPYNSADKKPGFFPDRVNPNDKNCPIFRVITKHGGTFPMRLAQATNKALHSAESNSILGQWIRNEMKVPSGTFITKQMLENYGKTYVTFRKYADGTYLLDF